MFFLRMCVLDVHKKKKISHVLAKDLFEGFVVITGYVQFRLRGETIGNICLLVQIARSLFHVPIRSGSTNSTTKSLITCLGHDPHHGITTI